MNGATPEDDAKTKSSPNNNKTVTIGMSHHNLRAHKNWMISPATLVLVIIPLKKFPIIDYPFTNFYKICDYSPPAPNTYNFAGIF